MSTTRTRRPRFRRETAGMPPLSITSRDLEILRRVAAHRFLRSSQVASLVGGSAQRILRRLQFLYHHGCLDRPAAQIDYYRCGGSREIAYGLARRGAELLHREAGIPLTQMRWSRKEGERQFLEHALMVSDVRVALELACRNSPGIRFLSKDDIPLPPATLKTQEPFHWIVNLSTRHRVGVIPDAVFGIEYENEKGATERSWFFLESDRSTMPVIRQNLDQSSYFRKLLAYEATWTQRIHRTRLGLHRFRVLSVTTSAERAAHLAEACAELERGHGLFLFTDLPSFQSAKDLLGHQWLATNGTDSLAPNSGQEKPSAG